MLGLITTALIVMMVVIVVQVFTRYVIFYSLPWSEELSRYLFVFIVVCGINVAVSREKLMEALWQTDSFVDENTLSVNMARLRKKLDGAGLTGFITTKIGAGYLVE